MMQSAHSALATKWIEVALACAVLLVGSLVYVLDRPPDSTAFFSALSIGQKLPGLFGSIGESLPSFTHAFSLSVLTAVCLGGGKRACLMACLIWFAIDCVFEAGQHAQLAERLVRFIPDWFEHVPVLDRADSYFLIGTFDIGDLSATAIGAATACLMTVRTLPNEINHE